MIFAGLLQNMLSLSKRGFLHLNLQNSIFMRRSAADAVIDAVGQVGRHAQDPLAARRGRGRQRFFERSRILERGGKELKIGSLENLRCSLFSKYKLVWL